MRPKSIHVIVHLGRHDAISHSFWQFPVFRNQEAGYEKLHNFLTDVAGLSLIGAGNRMELKLGDRDAFERFCDDLLVGREDRDGRIMEDGSSGKQIPDRTGFR